MKRISLFLLFLLLFPNLASAWWNEEWAYKKKISLDLPKLKQENINLTSNELVLIRLHTGNFLSFAEIADKGKDIRVLANDEKIPLKFYLEKFDAVNEMAFIWVNLPKEIISSPDPSLWLYFGNPEAVDGQDKPGTFDVSQVLSYQFNDKAVKDATANAINPAESTNTFSEGGLIAEAGVFNGTQIIRIPASPAVVMSPATGWTISSWLKVDQNQTNVVVFQRSGSTGNVALSLKEQTVIIQATDGTGKLQEFTGQGTLATGAWHHLALAANQDTLALYIDGVAAGSFPVKLGELDGELTIGADASGSRGFVGMLDQFGVYKSVKDANAIKFQVSMEGANSALLTYGDDQTPDSEEGGESYFVATLNNVTIDGWVIIGILAIMFIISCIVMGLKTVLINRTHNGNKKFEDAFSKLGAAAGHPNKDVGQQTPTAAPAILSLNNQDSEFNGSSLFRIYDTGVQEINKRLDTNKDSQTNLSSTSLAAVKASMDAVLIRELQKLNSQMVLLTIAISGGPFLGLLGTVVGVMITFAAIAVNGEVNVNSIAPGIAAALTATVAGLAVAIPALFGYNYIGSRIKMVAADMQVFVDEFTAKLAEQFS